MKMQKLLDGPKTCALCKKPIQGDGTYVVIGQGVTFMISVHRGCKEDPEKMRRLEKALERDS